MIVLLMGSLQIVKVTSISAIVSFSVALTAHLVKVIVILTLQSNSVFAILTTASKTI